MEVTRADLLKWCRIPMEQLAGHPDRKCEFLMEHDKEKLYAYIGNDMAEELIRHNQEGRDTKWILPSGHLDQYRYFAQRVNTERIDCSRLHVFHMDEWLDWQFRPIPAENSFVSARSIMQHGFYDLLDPSLGVPEENRHWPDVHSPQNIDDLIESMGGVDTVQGGIGHRGMVAFNEAPPASIGRPGLTEYASSGTRLVTIREETIIAYAQREFGCCYEAVPPNGITIGMKSLLNARRGIFLVTTGEWKQTVIRVALFSGPVLEYPVTLLTNRLPSFLLCCDENSADHVLSHQEDAGCL